MGLKRLFLPRWLAPILGSLLSLSAFADAPTVSNLAPSDVANFVRDFSADFAYSTVTPASSLGGLGGFEFGLVGGITKDPDIVALALQNNSSSNIPSYVAHAGLFGRLGLPYGLTAEALVFPSRTISSVTLKQYGGALDWTLTDSILDELPFNLMAKFSLDQAEVDYSETTTVSATAGGYSINQSVPVGITYKDTEWALQALASMKLLIFEPYVGVGYVHSAGKLDLSTSGATVSILNLSNYGAGSTEATSSPNSIQFTAGTDIRLAFFTIGAEYMRAFSVNSFTGRLSFRF